MTRVLILSAAIGYKPNQLLPMMRSLERVGFTGQLVFLIDRADADIFKGAKLPEFVDTIPVDRNLTAVDILNQAPEQIKPIIPAELSHTLMPPFLKYCIQNDFDWSLAFLTAVSHPSVVRYFYYLKLVVQLQDQFDSIILCDARDLYFQADPGKVLRPDMGVRYGLENPALPMGIENHNTEWINILYGPEAIKAYHGKPIACSGVTFGDPASMLGYLQRMVGEIVATTYRIQKRFGFDQPIHNKLGWDKAIPNMNTGENFFHEIVNINSYSSDFLLPLLQDDMFVRQDTNEPIMIVHQFDRAGRVCLRVLKRLDLTPEEISLEPMGF